GGFALLFQLRLTLYGETGEGNRLETRARDWFTGHFALPICPNLDALQRLVDFIKRVLFLREETQLKTGIACCRAGVGLVHSEGGSFAAFSAGAKGAMGHAGHRIDYRIAKLKQLLFLLSNERIQLLFAMI